MRDVLLFLCGLTSYQMLVTGSTDPCHLPFDNNGRIFYTCTSGGYSWCSTTYDYVRDKRWRWCTDTSEAENGVYVMLDDKHQLIRHQTGTIISHRGYPQKYPNHVDSTLRIQVSGVLTATLEVIFFELEPRENSGGCDDYFQINGGDKLCGNDLQAGEETTHMSNSGKLELKLSTDGWSRKKGFRIQYHYSVLGTVTSIPTYSPTTELTEPPTSTPLISVATSLATTTVQQRTETRSTSSAKPEKTPGEIFTTAISTRMTPTRGLTNDNQANTEARMPGQDNSVALGAGIGVSALVILIAVIIAVLVLMSRPREQAKSKPDDGDSGPTYGYTNQSAENTLQIRMSAIPAESENYYSMTDGLNNNPSSNSNATTSQNWSGAGETDYDMADQVETGDVYHLADDAGADNCEYTLAEEVTPNRTAGSAHAQSQVTGNEDEYQLADSTADDYANIESIHRAEDERTLEENYSSVRVTTKTKKKNSDPGVTELVENELYGS